MKTMKMMRFNDPSKAADLDRRHRLIPRASGGEILIRVHAAGVTPTESQWYPTTHTRDGGPKTAQFPVTNSLESSRRWAPTWIVK